MHPARHALVFQRSQTFLGEVSVNAFRGFKDGFEGEAMRPLQSGSGGVSMSGLTPTPSQLPPVMALLTICIGIKAAKPAASGR